ncbi:hypothetical protein [Sinorhizobium sp. RAC02]|uniref:hypothetical protein n=1 Tax=Sinorhizobium sp. RAC02 TaxID=1842534 RepID=UPI00083DC402|nr:hypothetical protein [Sinorhizobium sp. RAC02]AOF93093.1 putative membrane protein [Sinorhizobium sp. RAC02]
MNLGKAFRWIIVVLHYVGGTQVASLTLTALAVVALFRLKLSVVATLVIYASGGIAWTLLTSAAAA